MPKLRCPWHNTYLLHGRGGWFPPAGDFDDAKVVDVKVIDLAARVEEALVTKKALSRARPGDPEFLVSATAAAVREIFQGMRPRSSGSGSGPLQDPRRLVVNLVDYDLAEADGSLEVNGPLERGLHSMIASRSLDYQFFWSGDQARRSRRFLTQWEFPIEYGRDYTYPPVDDFDPPSSPAMRR